MEVFFSRCHSIHVSVKVGMLLFVCMTLFENGSTLQCNPCSEGWYIKRNCSKTEEGSLIGTKCHVCKKCDGEGQRILVNCTKWSNTMCGCEDGYIPQHSSNLCQKVTTTARTLTSINASAVTSTTLTTLSPPTKIWMLAVVLTVLGVVLIALALAVAVWLGERVPFKQGGRLPNAEYDTI